jgi:hypothetical protein
MFNNQLLHSQSSGFSVRIWHFIGEVTFYLNSRLPDTISNPFRFHPFNLTYPPLDDPNLVLKFFSGAEINFLDGSPKLKGCLVIFPLLCVAEAQMFTRPHRHVMSDPEDINIKEIRRTWSKVPGLQGLKC